MKFYLCEHCGNMATLVKDAGVPLVCCGEKMKQMEAGTTDAATEKHVPSCQIEGDKLFVTVGDVEHPMLDKHYIEWIIAETDGGAHFKRLEPGQAPKAEFILAGGESLKAVYEYCNLHGLWKA